MADFNISTSDVAMNNGAPILTDATIPAVKRQRKFMDIIRPTATAPVNTVRRQGVVIQPRGQEAAPIIDTAEPSAPDVTSIPAQDPAAAPSFGIDMDMTPQNNESTPAVPSSSEVVSSSAPQTSVASVPVPSESATTIEPAATPAEKGPEPPLVSPFLANIDVEKRPLGEFTGANESSSAQAPSDDANNTAGYASTPVIDSDTSVALAELNKEHIEPAEPQSVATISPESSKESSLTIEQSQINTPEEPVRTEEKPVVQDTVTQPATPAPKAAATAAVPAGGSIAQQYSEAPSTGDQTNGAIYDTKTYNQPIKTAPAKKKKLTVTIVVLWVVALVLIGGIAAAAYFYLNR